MVIAKIFAGAVLVAAPLSLVPAQSITRADSGSHGHRGEWLVGSGAAAGASFFLAFAQAGHRGGANTGTSVFHTVQTSPAGPTAPTGGLTPPAAGEPTPTSYPPKKGDVAPADTATTVSPPPAPPPGPGKLPVVAADSVPATTDSPMDLGDSLTVGDDGPFIPTTDHNPPPTDAPAFVMESSTVPEPGTLALTATGIIGLLPLIRRRR